MIVPGLSSVKLCSVKALNISIQLAKILVLHFIGSGGIRTKVCFLFPGVSPGERQQPWAALFSGTQRDVTAADVDRGPGDGKPDDDVIDRTQPEAGHEPQPPVARLGRLPVVQQQQQQ